LLLGQVLANVVTHMLRHGEPQDGPRIRIGAEKHVGEIVLKIVGARTPQDANLDERSFRTFERRHERDSFWRNGVGLAVARRTIERMNGRLWVDSGPGTNTCVNIGLPSV
jgi:light-regulated signal transduction histidine kinase (bacteriophytochrome)